jgi:hypothetical protein
MQESLKIIGQRLQKLFAGVARRPLGWSEIDKLAAIDEREEELNQRDGKDGPTLKDGLSRKDVPPRR